MVAENENIEISTKSLGNPYENVKGFVKDLQGFLLEISAKVSRPSAEMKN